MGQDVHAGALRKNLLDQVAESRKKTILLLIPNISEDVSELLIIDFVEADFLGGHFHLYCIEEMNRGLVLHDSC